MSRYLVFILTYFLGAIPFAYLAGRYKGIDIRHHGSGNMGTTNAFRLLGAKFGLLVLLGDALKGAFSALLGFWTFGPWGGILGGLLAMAGHSWNPLFGFRPSGKGVAAGFGIISVLMPKVMIVAITLFVLVVATTRYVSMGSVVGALTVAFSVFAFSEPIPYKVFGLVGATIVIFLHRANIHRLLQGTEHRFGEKK